MCNICLEKMKVKKIYTTERGFIWEYICKICGNKRYIDMYGKVLNNAKGR